LTTILTTIGDRNRRQCVRTGSPSRRRASAPHRHRSPALPLVPRTAPGGPAKRRRWCRKDPGVAVRRSTPTDRNRWIASCPNSRSTIATEPCLPAPAAPGHPDRQPWHWGRPRSTTPPRPAIANPAVVTPGRTRLANTDHPNHDSRATLSSKSKPEAGAGCLHLLGLHAARVSEGAGHAHRLHPRLACLAQRVTHAEIVREERKGKAPSDHALVLVERS
jgi:hypothetical protein